MAVDKLVDSTQLDADLTTVANAIRTKGGTSADLAFPAGFVSAVQAIPTGTTPTPDEVYDAYNSYVSNKVCPTIAHLTGTSITSLLFNVLISNINENTTLQEVYAPNVTSVIPRYINGGRILGGCLYNCTSLKTAYFPLLTAPGQDFFRSCKELQNLTAPNLSDLSSTNIFFECLKLTTLVFSKLAVTNIGGGVFRQCTSLTSVDLTGATLKFYGPSIFEGDTNLKTLILRVPALVGLANMNTFMNTPFASGGSGGTIYIPKALYDHLGDGTSLDYKAATNWSAVDGYDTITWAQIEGSIYETQYADGTPIT